MACNGYNFRSFGKSCQCILIPKTMLLFPESPTMAPAVQGRAVGTRPTVPTVTQGAQR